MEVNDMKTSWLCTAVMLMALGTGSAEAAQVKVTIQNLSATGGLNLSPLWVSFGNGTFDVFNAGAAATPGLKPLAELGDPSGLAARQATTDPGAVTGLIPVVGSSGLAQIEPGESGSIILTLNPAANRFFNFAAMVVPSNDAFTSLDNALAIFDSAGHFLGDKTLTLTGNDIWDAGTEADQLFGSAFIVGQNAMLGDAEAGNVMLHPGFGTFDGQMEPNGRTFNAADANVGARSGFSFARITISEVPEPSSWLLMLAALGVVFGALRISRRSRALDAA
jgi:hypothetical protein